MFYYVGRFFCAVFVRIFLKLSVSGIGNIPKKGAFILASNHVSYLDPIVVGVACPRGLHFMARHDLFKVPVLGMLIHSVGAIPVKRNSADLRAIKEAIKSLHSGWPLAIFPEGTRGGAGSEILKAHAGVGFLAAKAGVSVIPVFVRGTECALPRGSRWVKRCRISVCFGKEIPVESSRAYQEIAGDILAGIRSLA